MATQRIIAVLSLVLLVGVAPPPERGKGLVAADHPLASQAGRKALLAGGNAVDAAVAAALAAGVVQPSASGLGGGGFAMIRVDRGSPRFVDFREVAPASVDAEAYRDDRANPREGGAAVAVPSESRGLYWLISQYGVLSPAEVVAPAVKLARDGFPAGAFLVEQLGKTKLVSVSALWGRPQTGDLVVNRALATTLARWASTRGEDLHTGAGARAVVAAVAAAGGSLSAADLATVQPKERDPTRFVWKGRTVFTAPPPSSGGLVVGVALRAVEAVNLAELGQGSSAATHAVTEAFKHVYADRARYLGDPDFVDVPLAQLLSDERIAEVMRRFDPRQTLPLDTYGVPLASPVDHGTQHISVIDVNGGAVALTSTVNTAFGSGVVVTSLGLLLNNQMDDFSMAPGRPNAYGLLGSEANALVGGKRPLSSMSPTLVLDGAENVEIAIGASGGAQIPSSVVVVLHNLVEFGLDAQEAVAAPRFHHQWMPNRLVVEPGFPEDVRAALVDRGHEVVVADLYSCVQVVRRTADGELEAGADPRKGGWPAGVVSLDVRR